jgi:hypothetical protein
MVINEIAIVGSLVGNYLELVELMELAPGPRQTVRPEYAWTTSMSYHCLQKSADCGPWCHRSLSAWESKVCSANHRLRSSSTLYGGVPMPTEAQSLLPSDVPDRAIILERLNRSSTLNLMSRCSS